MARTSILEDYLQNYPFWMMDVGPIDFIGLPIFTPLFGFSSITSPVVSLSVRRIKEGNWPFLRKVVTEANIAPIICRRAAHFLDSDFWRWINATIHGDVGVAMAGPSPRRNLLLIHFFSRGPFANNTINAIVGGVGLTTLAGGTAAMASAEEKISDASIVSGTSASVMAGGFTASSAARQQAVRIPARAWVLYGSLPVRYKPATDFDAASGDMSIQELEIEYERFEEISLAAT